MSKRLAALTQPVDVASQILYVPGIDRELLERAGWGTSSHEASSHRVIARLMLDTNAFDAVLVEDAMLDSMRWGAEHGLVEVLVTHVQVDEILDTAQRDLEKAKQLTHALLQVGAREVTTYGAVLGHSRLGLAGLADEATSLAIKSFTGGNPAHLADALIAATADHLGVALVTNEARKGRFTAAFPGLQLWTVDDLRTLALELIKARARSWPASAPAS